MFKKIIWAILELVTIGSGTYIFIATMVNEDFVDHEIAGLGATLIVGGLLLRNWRLTLFVKEEKNGTPNSKVPEVQKTTVNTVLVGLLVLSFFLLNKKVNDTISDVDDTASELQNLSSRLDEVEELEYRLEDLETYAHRHY